MKGETWGSVTAWADASLPRNARVGLPLAKLTLIRGGPVMRTFCLVRCSVQIKKQYFGCVFGTEDMEGLDSQGLRLREWRGGVASAAKRAANSAALCSHGKWFRIMSPFPINQKALA